MLAPVFHSLPGASFIVNGELPVKDAALASAGGELRLANGVTLLAKVRRRVRLALNDLRRHGERSATGGELP
jgi:hypothetical protein